MGVTNISPWFSLWEQGGGVCKELHWSHFIYNYYNYISCVLVCDLRSDFTMLRRNGITRWEMRGQGLWRMGLLWTDETQDPKLSVSWVNSEYLSQILIWGTPLGGLKHFLTRKTMRNVLISNYHKIKKIFRISKTKIGHYIFFVFFGIWEVYTSRAPETLCARRIFHRKTSNYTII